jgi:hypothetical protein
MALEARREHGYQLCLDDIPDDHAQCTEGCDEDRRSKRICGKISDCREHRQDRSPRWRMNYSHSPTATVGKRGVRPASSHRATAERTRGHARPPQRVLQVVVVIRRLCRARRGAGLARLHKAL